MVFFWLLAPGFSFFLSAHDLQQRNHDGSIRQAQKKSSTVAAPEIVHNSLLGVF
jgi:hypothetical protein